MQEQELLQYFKQSGSLLEGHFKLSSGLHAAKYIQCAKALVDGKMSELICKAIADKIKNGYGLDFDKVIAPAMGGLIVGYETAKHLQKPSMFCERVDGVFEFRRGFEIEKGDKVVIIEDVVTTGKSSLEAVECVKKYGGQVVAEGCIVDRSNGKHNLPYPLFSLINLDIATYSQNNLPAELKDIPAVKPGSRFLK